MLIKKIIKKINKRDVARIQADIYFSKFQKYSFVDCKCISKEQFRASIIRLYHTIEKGLCYEDYRAGFGRENIEKLITSLEQYEGSGFDCSEFFYKTALSCLNMYINKNKEYGLFDKNLESRVKNLSGDANSLGGVIEITEPEGLKNMNYEQLLKSRHSIRHFSEKPLDINLITQAIQLAQYTPSACNRQGWKTRIIVDRKIITGILNNQNGNKGFGQEIDKLLIVTSDLRAQQRSREVFQAYIDGGMYAANILNALYYKGIGSVPLSAALSNNQEKNIRKMVDIDDAEVLIMFIGIGNYPSGKFLTTRSERCFENVQVI